MSQHTGQRQPGVPAAAWPEQGDPHFSMSCPPPAPAWEGPAGAASAGPAHTTDSRRTMVPPQIRTGGLSGNGQVRLQGAQPAAYPNPATAAQAALAYGPRYEPPRPSGVHSRPAASIYPPVQGPGAGTAEHRQTMAVQSTRQAERTRTSAVSEQSAVYTEHQTAAPVSPPLYMHPAGIPGMPPMSRPSAAVSGRPDVPSHEGAAGAVTSASRRSAVENQAVMERPDTGTAGARPLIAGHLPAPERGTASHKTFGSRWNSRDDHIPDADGHVDGCPLVIAVDMDLRRLDRVCRQAGDQRRREILVAALEGQMSGLLLDILPRGLPIRPLRVNAQVLSIAFGGACVTGDPWPDEPLKGKDGLVHV